MLSWILLIFMVTIAADVYYKALKRKHSYQTVFIPGRRTKNIFFPFLFKGLFFYE